MTMRKKLAVSLLLLTFLLMGVVPVQALSYQGASQWAVAELDKALDYGLITDRICSQMNAPITREEFAEIAVKLYEKGTGEVAAATGSGAFADTSNPEISKAYDLGIVSGTDEARRLFSPHGLITREQVAAMMYRTIQAMGALKDGAAFAVFMDSDQIAPYAQEAVHYMGGWELIKGSDHRFNPRGNCTREMAVMIAVRVYESADTFDPPPTESNENYDYSGGNDYNYNDNGDDYDFDGGDNGYNPGNDPGYSLPTQGLPDNMSKLIPLLPDAQITYIDKWDGGDGSVYYGTSYSVSKALEFYRDPALYSELRIVEESKESGVDTISVQTNGLHYLIKVSENNNRQGPPTIVMVSVFWHMYMEGVLAFPRH